MGIKYWLFAIGLIDLFAVSVVTPLVPLFLKQSGINPSATGFYLSIYGIVQLFSSPIIGHWSDKHGKKKVFFNSLILTSIAFLLSSLLLDRFIALALVRIFLGVAKHTQDLCRNLIVKTAKTIVKTTAISQYNSISAVGYVLGPAISGLLSQYFGLRLTLKMGFLFCAFACVFNAFIVQYILNKSISSKSNKKTSGVKMNTEKDYNEIKFDWKANSGMFVSRFLLALSVMLYRSSFTLGLLHSYPKLTVHEISYFSSYNAFITFFLGYCCSYLFSLKFYAEKEEKLQLHAHFIISFAFAMIAFSKNLLALMLGLAVLVIGTSASKACGIVLPIKRFGENQAGKALGFNSSIISMARSLAPIIAGLAQEYSYEAPVFLSICVSVLSLAIFCVTVYLHPVPELHVKSD